jgi:hypothetical protein
MRDTKISKELIEFDILASPIGLHMDDFATKETLNMPLELDKHVKHLIFAFKQV